MKFSLSPSDGWRLIPRTFCENGKRPVAGVVQVRALHWEGDPGLSPSSRGHYERTRDTPEAGGGNAGLGAEIGERRPRA